MMAIDSLRCLAVCVGTALTGWRPIYRAVLAADRARDAAMPDPPPLFFEPHPQACCQWDAYDVRAWSYYPYSHDHRTGQKPMAVDECANACVATDNCTGIEVKTTFELGSAHVSDYCGFWYDYACSKESDPGFRASCAGL